MHRSQPRSVAALAGLAAIAFLSACQGAAEPPPGSVAEGSAATSPSGTVRSAAPTATVDRAVERTVTAEGRLVQPLQPQPLSFGASGTLTEILVDVGQPVAAGDVVARIDAGPLDLAVSDARAALAQAEAALARLDAGGTIETARLDVERAKNQLWGIQSQRDAICGAYERGQKEGGIAKMAAPSSAECNAAQANVQASEQAVQIAETQLRAAEASAPAERRSAGAAVERARLALAQAQERLAESELATPFAGTVTAVHLLEGLAAAPGVPVVTVAPEGPLEFVTDNLSERDIAGIELGAPATIHLAAFPDESVQAFVGRIAAEGAASPDGVVVFPVHLYLADDTGLPVRAGMTGRAEITVPGAD